ncbi:MAG TPA: DUF4468 domain-containing protein [Chitinophagales bacterium]|nr:DUF4468 domain-containing protein [Chitinophagales bacterium]
MRWLAFLIFQFLLLEAFTQGNPLVYTEVVKVDSTITKNVLFERARAWLNDNFRDYKEVSQIQDKESGELSVGGILFTHYLKNTFGQPLPNYPCYVRFKLSIMVKDGRYKYKFSDFTDECISSGSSSSPRIITDSIVYKEKGFGHKIINDMWIDVKTRTSKEVDLMISSLKSEMEKETTTEEW